MKILWISHNVPYPPKGGVLQRNFNLIREASKYNDVYIVAFNQKAFLPTQRDLDDAVNSLKTFCKHIEVISLPSDKSRWSKIKLLIKSLFTVKPYTVNWNQSSEMMSKISEVTTSFKPDLIHYDTIGLAEYYNHSFTNPQVLNHHNIESAMMFRRAEKEKNIFKRIYFYQEAVKIKRYEQNHCCLFNFNIAVSNNDNLLLNQLVSGINSLVIDNGVDTSYFAPKDQVVREEASLVFAGGMGWYPNKDAMLYFVDKVWHLLKSKHNNIKMTIIGGSPPAKLTNLAENDPNLVVTGFVDDVRPYLDKAAIYVCPIRDGGGTKLKILDALSMGKPIVATTIAVEGINVIPERHFLASNTPEQIANNIIRLLEDKNLYHKLSLEGRKLATEYYDWSLIGKKLNDAYNNFQFNNNDKTGVNRSVEKYFDDVSNDYLKYKYKYNRSYMTVRQENMIKFLDRYSDKKRKQKILDAGCGPGEFILKLSEKGCYDITAVDLSKKMLGLASKQFSNSGMESSVNFAVSAIEYLPFSDNTFDIVSTAGVIEYLDNDDKVLFEFNRILKKNGTLLISITNQYSYNLIFDNVIEMLRRNTICFSIMNIISKHLTRTGKIQPKVFNIRKHSPQAFRNDLIKNGFKVTDETYFYFLPFPHPFNFLCKRLSNYLGTKLDKLGNTKLGILGEGYLLICQKTEKP